MGELGLAGGGGGVGGHLLVFCFAWALGLGSISVFLVGLLGCLGPCFL